MSLEARRICCWVAAAVFLMLGLYCALGVLQAGSIHVGERALQNLQFWGAAAVISLAGSLALGLYAIRLTKAIRRK